MAQEVLPFQYSEDRGSSGLTAMAGLAAYLDLWQTAGLPRSRRRHLGVTQEQGWPDAQVVTSLALLNLAGGECVDDLRLLEKDEGLGRALRLAETHGMRSRERWETLSRWRKDRRRSVPSASSVFRFLDRFHDEKEEGRRQAHSAFIPAPTAGLQGLRRFNADLVGFVQDHAQHKQATLDMDATLIDTHKDQALYCYKKHKAYQPFTVYWAEADLIVHTEFRDGNVPVGHQQLRVLREALEHLPSGVEQVLVRSDTAGYQQEFLRYCAEGRNRRFGVIGFAVGADVTPELRAAVSEVAEEEWQALYREVDEHRVDTGQQWAEVNFVPNWIGHSRNSLDCRFIAIREPFRNPPLPGMESQVGLSPHVIEAKDGGWFKVFGIVTNRDVDPQELIWWSRQRCGKLPSGLFGANAAWWAITALAFNLNSAMTQLALGKEWVIRRLKAVRGAGPFPHHVHRFRKHPPPRPPRYRARATG